MGKVTRVYCYACINRNGVLSRPFIIYHSTMVFYGVDLSNPYFLMEAAEATTVGR